MFTCVYDTPLDLAWDYPGVKVQVNAFIHS